MAPLLPGVSNNHEAMQEYFGRAANLGVTQVMCDLLHYRETQSVDYIARLRAYFAALADAEETGGRPKSRPALSRTALAQTVAHWAAYYGITCKADFS